MKTLRHVCGFLSLLLLPLLLVSCSSSKKLEPLSTYLDPDFIGVRYDTVVVWFNTAAIDWRQDFERRMARWIDTAGGTGLQSGRIAPPTRAWDSASLFGTFTAVGARGLLLVEIDQTEVRQHNVPAKTVTTHNTKTTTTEEPETTNALNTAVDVAKVVIETVAVKSTQTVDSETTTETTGGYTYSEDYRRLQVSMIDLPSGRRMWVTTIRQSGDIMDDMDIMTRRIARQLWVDGVVR